MPSAATVLKQLEVESHRFGGHAGERKRAFLDTLADARLPHASQVDRLHEVLCYLRAIPDSPALLDQVESMLDAFERREDLDDHREALADTGIAGTAIHFPFDVTTARWMVRTWPDLLTIDWDAVADPARLMDRVYLMALDAETPGLDNDKASAREWLERMRASDETDAAFVIRRFERLPWPPFLRDIVYDEMNVPLVLAPGAGTPSRTHARLPGGTVHFQSDPLRPGRPDLKKDAKRPPEGVTRLDRRAGQAVIDLTQAAMATRQRYLDAFSAADPDDVQMVDAGDGLEFAVIGVKPSGRMLLEAVYGWLMLRNRVPIGYVLSSALFGSSEIAFNLFPTWRGGDAAWLYGRVIATTRALFGSDTYTVDPYQLGFGNQEGLDSGAWWFYQKLGLRPRDPDVATLMKSELAKIRKNPRHRSSPETLTDLARHPMFLDLGRKRRNVLGYIPLQGIGKASTQYVAERFGAARERGERICADEAAVFFGARNRAAWSAGERLMWPPVGAPVDRARRRTRLESQREGGRRPRRPGEGRTARVGLRGRAPGAQGAREGAGLPRLALRLTGSRRRARLPLRWIREDRDGFDRGTRRRSGGGRPGDAPRFRRRRFARRRRRSPRQRACRGARADARGQRSRYRRDRPSARRRRRRPHVEGRVPEGVPRQLPEDDRRRSVGRTGSRGMGAVRPRHDPYAPRHGQPRSQRRPGGPATRGDQRPRRHHGAPRRQGA